MQHVPAGLVFDSARSAMADMAPSYLLGRVTAVAGLSAEIGGLTALISVGDRVTLTARDGRTVAAEIVGFRDRTARAMAFGEMEGIGPGSLVQASLAPGGRTLRHATLAPSAAWLGRVIDPAGNPLDGRGALPRGEQRRRVRASPPDAAGRARLGPRLDLGVGVLNAFTTCRQGQRLGLFAGSGVGKSTLLAMLARHTACDVAVLALVGERGREVREFLEDDLGPAGLARSVVVAATSDMPPLARREAAYAAMTVAESFRDAGKSVLLLMDSVTRFCLALREIGLSAGEPPATRGYPPSVFAELPRLLERAGPGPEGFRADHSLVHRAGGGRRPQRTRGGRRSRHPGRACGARPQDWRGGPLPRRRRAAQPVAHRPRVPAGERTRGWSAAPARSWRPTPRWPTSCAWGAYKAGTDAAVDEAVALAPRIERALQQDKTEGRSLSESFLALATAMEVHHGG